MDDIALSQKIHSMLPFLDERQTRLYLASEAKSLGRGGKQKIASIAHVSRMRIDKGMRELDEFPHGASSLVKIRKSGAGRKNKKEEYENLVEEIDTIVSPYTRGDPMNPLRWTSKSLRQITDVLKIKGYKISHVTVGEVLKSSGYSLQANKKTDEGAGDIDRDEQFENINTLSKQFIA